jgi:hypothetical protein
MTSPVSGLYFAASDMSVALWYWNNSLVAVYIPVAKSYPPLPGGYPGRMFWIGVAENPDSCASEIKGNAAANSNTSAMAGTLLIKRGQLNRTSRHCQADLLSNQ